MDTKDIVSSQEAWECLDGEVNANSSKDFIGQFQDLFGCQKAKQSQGVVYAWVTDAPIPRLRGKSNIIYIGKTIHSLYARHHRWAEVEGNEYNWPRYKQIIEEYGPIRVYFLPTSDPKAKESALLEKYYFDHCEYPPVNRASK